MTDIDIDATRQTPEVAEPGNNTFVVWYDQNGDPFVTFYREDAYASGKVRWLNADQYDTGDDDDPKSWAELCELADGMKGPQLLVPGAKVDELTAERDEWRESYDLAHADRLARSLERDRTIDEREYLKGELAKATAALAKSREQAATYANEVGTLTAENARVRQQRDALVAERAQGNELPACTPDCPANGLWGATGRVPGGHMIARNGGRVWLAHTEAEPADRPVCGEPADASRFFRCQKNANHYGERHHTVIPGGDLTWGYVPTPGEKAEATR